MSIAEIYQAISAVAPISYVEFPSTDKETWRIGFLPEATEEQKTSAYNLLKTLNIS